MSNRMMRLKEAVKQELAVILQKELKDPRLGFITVTAVEVSGDYKYCKVYVSVIGSEEEQKESLNVLKKVKSYLRGELCRRLRLRLAPELTFELDRSLEHGARVAHLLNEVRRRGELGDAGTDGQGASKRT